MDTILEAQLTRMETALGTLLSSIITYNPSVSAADELLLADDELNKGLQQLTTHQNNYTRLLQLRHESELLDSKIKSSVQLLADIRKDLLAIPLDAPKEPIQPVPYKTLLTYAKNIAPFTLPASFRPKPRPTDTNTNQENKAQEGDESVVTQTPAIEGADTATGDGDGDPATKTTITAEHQALLDDLKNMPFQPWPGELEMEHGALNILNHQVVNGNDPTDISRVVQEERYLEEQRKQEELEVARRRDAAAGRANRPAPGARTEQPAANRARFGLDDDDEEDEDD